MGGLLAPEPILETIARKEQELRARLLLVRAEAERLVASARSDAEEMRVRGEAAAAAEAETWLRNQHTAAEEEAAATKAGAEQLYENATADDSCLEAAVRVILNAVLPIPSPRPARERPQGFRSGPSGSDE